MVDAVICPSGIGVLPVTKGSSAAHVGPMGAECMNIWCWMNKTNNIFDKTPQQHSIFTYNTTF